MFKHALQRTRLPGETTLKRAVLCLFMITAFGGCASYGVVHTSESQATTPTDPTQFAYNRLLTASDLYTLVQVDVKPVGSALQPCSETVWNSIMRSRKRTVLVAAKFWQGDNSDKGYIPIYFATQDGTASCLVVVPPLYLTPRQVLNPLEGIRVVEKWAVSDQGTEKISGYLSSVAEVMTLITPVAPQAGVIAAALTAVLQSPAGQKLSESANAYMTSANGVTGTDLVKLDSVDAQWALKQNAFTINLQKYWNRSPDGEPIPLATATVTLKRSATYIGVDSVWEPALGNSQFGKLPRYINLTSPTSTTIWAIQVDPSGLVTLSQVKLYDNTHQAAENLKNLPPNADPKQVGDYCLAIYNDLGNVLGKRGKIVGSGCYAG